MRNIRNSYINVRTGYYSDYENEFSKNIQVERPLYSPLARWSGRLGYYENRFKDEVLGIAISIYTPTLMTRTFDAFGSWVNLLKKRF